ncbi:MAG: hypothetical protein QOG20_4248 [Pseudonocardiales bacterium]|uniref:hypothetical protein n=1 Tax=Pseudonocardia sp. TaxID=60912 RepID=UPI00262DB49E|nr:hypothetical protein [Pseudonocardia sp.]MCW2718236.1 hypothetical protein [Pseudonocardia sp.]MDT7615212.1 hypothetical protein [Pseudonocardiales bacterium]MDT7708641.1 hypothetical protein [Pseudonocardiales bacterium]
MVIGLLFALCAMLLNSVAGLLQAEGTRRVGARRPLITQPTYLAGLVIDLLGWVCTVVALRHLPVFAVQAILGGTIAVTALASRVLYGSRLRHLDRIAIGACVVGLVLVAAGAGTSTPEPASVTAYAWLVAAMAVLGVAAVALWRTGWAWALAVVAGLGFGGTSLAIRAVQVPRTGSGVVALLSQPAPYLIVGFCAIGLACYSRALALGSLSQVTALFLVTEVVVPGVIGVVLLGDTVRDGWYVPTAVGLLLAVSGVIVLAGSPAQAPPRRRRVL